MKIIINADDFGYSECISKGIIESYKNGIVTSTTIMMNMPFVEYSLELYKEVKGLGLGVHLNLTTGKPLLSKNNTLVTENGEFHKRNEVINYDINDAYIELKTQIEKLISYGYYPSHLDTHHDLQATKELRECISKLALEYKLPLRINESNYMEFFKNKEIKTVDKLIKDFHKDNIQFICLENIIKNNSNYEIVEIMTHTGYMDEETAKVTSYNYEREVQLKSLTSMNKQEFCDKYNVELINYNDLKERL